MEVNKVVGLETQLILWVNCYDGSRFRNRPYLFKWNQQSNEVSFLFGGWGGESRYVGNARTLEEARKLAEPYLVKWLRSCGVFYPRKKARKVNDGNTNGN